MNIIIEGIDKAGKSTMISDLTAKLKELYDIEAVIFKISKKPKGPDEVPELIRAYEELFHQTEDVRNKEHIFLFDRSYPSEMVYAPKRGYDSMNNEGLKELDARLGRNENTILIYCEANAETIRRRFIEDKEEYASLEDIEMLLQGYDKFLSLTVLPYIRISSENDREKNLNEVIKYLEEIDKEMNE